ncbi:MAG: phospholipase D-like domain-containing protein [Steroidobacteraceae bacterium]
MRCDGDRRDDALLGAGSAPSSLLRPGQNCYRATRASRAAVLIDGDAYFRAFTQAALRATRSIVIVGWDFDSRTALHLGQPGVPDTLGEFLNFLARRRRGLQVNILVWDSPIMFSRGRERSPSYGLGWHPHAHVHFEYDNHCPVGAALHQKIVVMDAAVAFCGGLDLTRGRWDTPAHRPSDPRRKNPGEQEPYAPFHDAMLAVEGESARVLHDLAGKRWRRATGRLLARKRTRRIKGVIEKAADSSPSEVWPTSLAAEFTDLDVGIARTVPSIDGAAPIIEVRHLYLDMIAAARRCIYLENQYFTAGALGAALAARLAERDGPEIIVVLRLSSSDWLEARAMSTLRTLLLRRLCEADRYGRFHAYYPYTPDSSEEQGCDVHTKLMIVDDAWLRLGSANFANRSMWLDTECDLVLEAAGVLQARASIAGVRDRFLAEHLEVSPQQVRHAADTTDSLSAAIEKLARSEGRTLRRFQRLDAPSEALVAAARVADPERPAPVNEVMTGAAAHSGGEHKDSGPRTGVAGLLGTLVAAAVRRLFRPATDRHGPGRP